MNSKLSSKELQAIPIAFRQYSDNEELVFRILIYYAITLNELHTHTATLIYKPNQQSQLFASVHATLFFYYQQLSASNKLSNPDPNYILPESMPVDSLPAPLSVFIPKSLKAYHPRTPKLKKKFVKSTVKSGSVAMADILHVVRSFLYTFKPIPPVPAIKANIVSPYPTSPVKPLSPSMSSPLLPIKITSLSSHVHIGLCSKNLVQLTPFVASLQHANVLQLCCNKLTSLPPHLGYLSQLTILSVSKNLLTSVPNEIGHLTNLMELDLSHNSILEIPVSIGRLHKLHILRLNHNKIKHVPFHLGRLLTLVQLDLSDNPITSIPSHVVQLKHLRKLRTRNCPLLFTPLSPVPTTSAHFHLDPVTDGGMLSLRELAARALVTATDVSVDMRNVPHDLVNYLLSFEYCSICSTPVFESRIFRYRKLVRGGTPAELHSVIPSHDLMCRNHWESELDRINSMFSVPTCLSTSDPVARSLKLAAGLGLLKWKDTAPNLEIRAFGGIHLRTVAGSCVPSLGPLAALHATRILPPLPPIPSIPEIPNLPSPAPQATRHLSYIEPDHSPRLQTRASMSHLEYASSTAPSTNSSFMSRLTNSLLRRPNSPDNLSTRPSWPWFGTQRRSSLSTSLSAEGFPSSTRSLDRPDRGLDPTSTENRGQDARRISGSWSSSIVARMRNSTTSLFALSNGPDTSMLMDSGVPVTAAAQ